MQLDRNPEEREIEQTWQSCLNHPENSGDFIDRPMSFLKGREPYW
jgi:hypothetical protein